MAKTIEEKFSLEDQMYEKEQSLLDKKYRAKKIIQKSTSVIA